MSFTSGFEKIAGYSEALGGAGKGLLHGLKDAGSETIKDALKLKGAREAAKTFKGKTVKEVFQTAEGGKTLGHAIGKSLPSAAAGALYTAGAVKAYKKLKSDTSNSYDQAQNSQYYYR